MFKDPIEVSTAMMRMAGYMMECQMRIGLGLARAAWGQPPIPARQPGARGPVSRPNETARRVVVGATPVVVDVSPRHPADPPRLAAPRDDGSVTPLHH